VMAPTKFQGSMAPQKGKNLVSSSISELFYQ
jgi:hypothetical protein